MNIEVINKVLRGKRRKEILYSLLKSSKTPNLIAKELKISITNMPKFLNDLTKDNLIACDNPENYHYKLYYITEKGKEILKEIETLESTN